MREWLCRICSRRLNSLFSKCALRVLFAPSYASQVPHLRQANCGLARLFGTKSPSQNPLAGGVEQTAHPRPSQALHLLRDMHSLREWKILVLLVFLVFPVFLAGVTGVTGATGKTGEFESRLFSGRCEALRRRVADKVGALSNLFEGGLLIWLLYYLRKIATPHRKGCTKSFWATFYKESQK